MPLSARAADHGSGITSVLFQFSRDGQTWRPVVTRSESAGAVYWDTTRVEDGEYALRAVVADVAGNLTASDRWRCGSTTRPRGRDRRAAVGGIPRRHRAAAGVCGRRGSGVIAVRFEWSRGRPRVGRAGDDIAPPYGYSWDTTRVADGTYHLRAVARDRAGNSAFGEPIELTVRNTLVFAEPAPPPEPEPAAEAAPEPEPEPAAEPVTASVEAATLWQLERLLEQRGAGLERREELEALLYTLRPYARPDGDDPASGSGRSSGTPSETCSRGSV